MEVARSAGIECWCINICLCNTLLWFGCCASLRWCCTTWGWGQLWLEGFCFWLVICGVVVRSKFLIVGVVVVGIVVVGEVCSAGLGLVWSCRFCCC